MSFFWIVRYSVAFVAPARVKKIRFTAAIILLMVWVASFALVISLVQTKLSWYVLGIVPALYVIAASALKHAGVPRAFATIGVVALLGFYVWQLPHWKPVPRLPARGVAYDLRNAVPGAPIVLYRTGAWNFGRVLPATYWHLRYQGLMMPVSIDRDNLEHYLAQPEYRVWVMEKDAISDLKAYPEFAAFTLNDPGDNEGDLAELLR